MTRLFGPHPGIYAFLLGGGAFLALYCGWKNFVPSPPAEMSDWNTDLMKVMSWGLMIIGILMWLAGGILLGRDRGMPWPLALCLHLLPVLGIVLIVIIGKSPTPHEAWARQNPGLDEKTAKRIYRPMKPLY